MKCFAKCHEIPLVIVQPEGWLRRYLRQQRTGLTGHLEVAGFPFDARGWGCARIKADGIE